MALTSQLMDRMLRQHRIDVLEEAAQTMEALVRKDFTKRPEIEDKQTIPPVQRQLIRAVRKLKK